MRGSNSGASLLLRREMKKEIAMKSYFCAGIVAGMMLLASSAHAQFARQELLAFQSITLSDDDLLQGKNDGKAVTLAARLLLPGVAADAKYPAVILIHGSGGVGGAGASVAQWERELPTAGIAVFTVDSFTGRGIVSTVADQSQLGLLGPYRRPEDPERFEDGLRKAGLPE
jgi:hypothetical protein